MKPFLCALAATFFVGCSTSELSQIENQQDRSVGQPQSITIYSPAPPKTSLSQHNFAAADILRNCLSSDSVAVAQIALPRSINNINKLDKHQKPFHLPIVTTLDFRTAINQTAPDWHGYEQANADLKLVGALYEVAFGIMVFDPKIEGPQGLIGKRVAVPARPSAVRWFAESLLKDGWAIADQVELVSMSPPEVSAAIKEGRVDAVAWNIMSRTPDGFVPLLPALFNVPNATWLNISTETLNRINASSPFKTSLVEVTSDSVLPPIEGDSVQLLSFKQGLAAWDSTPDTLVREIVACLSEADRSFGEGRDYLDEQLVWPGLSQSDVHPAAR